MINDCNLKDDRSCLICLEHIPFLRTKVRLTKYDYVVCMGCDTAISQHGYLEGLERMLDAREERITTPNTVEGVAIP